MVKQESPYLPDIIREAVVKVNGVTTTYPVEEDRFTVGFNHGRMEQVGKDIYAIDQADVMVWLPMTFDEYVGRSVGAFAEMSIDLLIGAKTENTYTQAQRDELVFKPKLIPVYHELLRAINASQGIAPVPGNARQHTRQLKPYWGGGAVKGTDTKNLWTQFIDAILIMDLKIKLKHYKDCSQGLSLTA